MTSHAQAGRTVTVDVLVLTASARPGQHVAALAIDAAIVLIPGLAAVVAFVAGATAFGWMLAAGAAVAAIALTVALARTGRTPGRLAAGTRTVALESAAPAGRRLLADALTGRLRTFDLVRGRDPISAALAPYSFPPEALAPAKTTVPHYGFTRPAVVELDTGERLQLAASLILGRDPVAPADAPAAVHRWSDLSRTLSKSHARLEWDGQQAWVVDLGSTNGTAVVRAGAEHPLIPFQRTPLPDGTRLRLGDRHLTVRTTS
ncbi:FHA domain-containing protein [Microbacterium sp. NEAU-LLC]|uniref:FHA domain-containing protein n=1 Tax=Microbacterium helvum TaxID=2773713 RepID=A0ABR8NPV3_9MICO|nr:FHA domain-containing protein [Microbacterium helvum]MBD3942209.1 FHA domain-containing protein [Microbacterium helvum]